MRRLLRGAAPYLPYVLVFLLALGARLVPGPRTIDDAYITYRYAGHILAGDGFVYNPGERVLGTTTPLYTLLMVVLGGSSGGVGAPFPALALGFNALADAATALLLVDLGRRTGWRLAGWGAGLVWAILPFSVTFAIGGLETSLYVLLLVAAWTAYARARYSLTGLLASLALLTRPDALILILPLGFDRLVFDSRRRGRRLSWGEMAAFFLPTAAWFAFASLYFGNPLPHSIAAKAEAYHLPPLSALTRLLQHYATPFMGDQTFGNAWIKIGLVLYPFLYLAGALQVFRKGKEHWPFLAFPWLYLAAFALPNPLIFRWYLTPPTPFYILGILEGAERLLGDLFRIRGKEGQPWTTESGRWPARAVRLFFVILAPLTLALNTWQVRPDHGLERPAPEMAWYKLELVYRQAAELLAPQIEQRSEAPLLAAGDVGVLGYYTAARILDTVGLNSPQTLAYYPLPAEMYTQSAYAVAPDLIADLRPDFVVILETYGRLGLLKDARFLEQYRLLYKIPTDIYDSDGMLIFARRGRP